MPTEAELGGKGREGKEGTLTSFPVCNSFALRRVKDLSTSGKRAFCDGDGGGPLSHRPFLLALGLGGVTPQVPAGCPFPHTRELVKVTLLLHLSG